MISEGHLGERHVWNHGRRHRWRCGGVQQLLEWMPALSLLLNMGFEVEFLLMAQVLGVRFGQE